MGKQGIKILIAFFCFINLSAIAQKIIEGRVYDADSNTPLSGVLIFAKNTIKTTKTDLSGSYRIIIPEKANILVFSIAGYIKQEISINDVSSVDVGMRSFASRETDNVVVIGSRDPTRTKNDSYSAIDVIPVKSIVNQFGYIELPQILHYFIPSFNANKQSGADLSDHVDPLSLRGLGPDQILFLVNGKRFLRSSTINVFGTRGRGNVNSDLNSIPASAVDRVEILRDGAAAQYGSDAIAGVVNIVLKSDMAATTGAVTFGTNYTGWGNTLNYKSEKLIQSTTDGQSINANVSHTFKIKESSLTVTADYFSRASTLRPNNETFFPDANYRQHFGDAKLSAKNLYFSNRVPLKNGEIYAFGGLHSRNTESAIWTISPDDSSRNVYQIYPNGFNPHLLTTIKNSYLTFGVKNKIRAWDIDLSYSLGENNVKMRTEQTLNPSLLLKSPSKFNNGAYQFGQYIFNGNMSRKFPLILKGLNIAMGGEHHYQSYSIIEGEEASWKTYTNSYQKVGTSQGFPGVSPTDALKKARSQVALYGDAELALSNKLLIAAALRSEIISNFGQALGGRFAIRYKPIPQYSIRFSMQKGFRLPSLAQIYYRATINDVDAKGGNYEKIIFNGENELAAKLNVPALSPEQSINYSFGMSFKPNSNWSFAADAYNIIVKNRIILTGRFGQNDDKIGNSLKTLNLRFAQFFINALYTNTKGCDILASYKTKLGSAMLTFNLNGNINYMTAPVVLTNDNFKGKENILINKREALFITQTAPLSKFHSAINVRYKKSIFNLNITRFSKVETAPLEDVKEINNIYAPRIVTDVNYGVYLDKFLTISLGLNNIFDIYPTIQNPGLTESGGHWEAVQNGFSGAFFFSRMSFHF